MFEKLANIFRVPDLRKRVLFTLAMLAVYRLGSHIPKPGIGNGMSLLIFAGIVAGLPRGVLDLWDKARTGAWGGSFTPIAIVAVVAAMILVVAFIIYVERSERRIRVEYAKRVV